jgi:hypothetical protein
MLHAIAFTPVKDSIDTTLETIIAIAASDYKVHHIVYNDFSSVESKNALIEASKKYPFELIHLEDITDHPSPNYKLVLQNAQERALKENLPLIVIESDVKIEKDTIQKMVDFNKKQENAGLIGAVTVDQKGIVNFPYLKFKDEKATFLDTKRSLSFCCTLMNSKFLETYSFQDLNNNKDWFDVFISGKAIELGFKNYILMDAPVLHQPHGSRPWKHLKYTNPLKYYFLKLINKRDKI